MPVTTLRHTRAIKHQVSTMSKTKNQKLSKSGSNGKADRKAMARVANAERKIATLVAGNGEPPKPKKKIDKRTYEKALKKLHVELVKLQEWIQHKGLEGRRAVRRTRRGRQRWRDQADHRVL